MPDNVREEKDAWGRRASIIVSRVGRVERTTLDTTGSGAADRLPA
jgi:hypothetical protein